MGIRRMLMVICLLFILAPNGMASVECEPDGNDTSADATLIGLQEEVQGVVCPDDTFDYYYFDLSTSHTVELWLTNIPSGCDYDLALRSAGCSLIKHSDNPGNANEHLQTGALSTGPYYIQVYAYQGRCSQPYHLRVVYE